MKRCYLDRRRKCLHPEVKKTCELNVMICEEMKPIRGEWHEILESETLLKKHSELRKHLVPLENH